MHWILQDNIFKESAYDNLVDVLQRAGIPHSQHKVVPFVGELMPAPELDTSNVICFGSYSMRHYAKKMGWNPGVFDLEPFDFQQQVKHWDTEMLNWGSEIVLFGEAAVRGDKFIRPTTDSKVFAGRVIGEEEFADWQRKVCVLEEDDGSSLTKNTLIQVCPTIQIYAEYRFWVVRGEIVCASLYKRGDKVVYSDTVDQFYFDYVRQMVDVWCPHDAFCIDVCNTHLGPKIVEINTINSSGFYACNIPKLVAAMEHHFNE